MKVFIVYVIDNVLYKSTINSSPMRDNRAGRRIFTKNLFERRSRLQIKRNVTGC